MPNIAPDGTWRYTGAHDLYPVQQGQIWKVGDHVLACGDLQGDTPLAQAITIAEEMHGPIGLMYVDPPWNNGNARSFRTKAGADGPEGGHAVDILELITAVITPAAERNILAFMEGGNRELAKMHKHLQSMGAITTDWPITYYRTKPCFVMACDFRLTPAQDYPDLAGLDDDDTPSSVLANYGHATNRLVIDPCAGRGLTARSAQNNGWASITHELSPYRMAEAMKSLSHAGTPERII
jgi:hypothetical protein